MPSEPLTLSHRQLLLGKLGQLKIDISEYTFANLYLFRQLHHYELVNDGEELLIKGISRDGLSFLMPTQPMNQALAAKMSSRLTEVDMLFPIPKAWLTHFDPTLFSWTSNPDDSDYIYTTEAMRTYPGRQLSGKRNLVKQFLEQHEDISSAPLTAENSTEALQILDEWQQETNSTPHDNDYYPCKEALTLLDSLGLEGRLFYAEDKPAAFLIGEPLHAGMYVLHFSKANKHIKGLYQYTYEAFAQSLPDSYHELNMEQDLGSPAVRQAKHSYMPERMAEKWRITLKN